MFTLKHVNICAGQSNVSSNSGNTAVPFIGFHASVRGRPSCHLFLVFRNCATVGAEAGSIYSPQRAVGEKLSAG